MIKALLIGLYTSLWTLFSIIVLDIAPMKLLIFVLGLFLGRMLAKII